MLDSETRRRIDTARDILVGKVPDPKSQVEQITIALVYKFMDDMDKQSIEMGGRASFFKGEFKKYGWSDIFDPRLGGIEMLSLYGEAITRMSQNENLPELFRNIFKNAFLPYRDPETLKLFLKTINEFTYDHSEKLGDAFEYLLSVLGSQGDAGQFRTPRHIIDFMVQVLDPKKNETILDPACGTAGFLISAYKHIVKSNQEAGKPLDKQKVFPNFTGYDISPDMVRLSLVNLYLHGFVKPNIHEYDTLTSEDRWNEYADVILANPPFMSPKGGIQPHKRFSVQSNRSEVLFVDYMAEHLTPNGRAAIIVPEGIVFQSAGAYKQLRKYLIEHNYLWAVVSLPAGVFNPYAGVKTSVLFLDKTLAKKTDQILFVKVEKDGYDLGAQRRALCNDIDDKPESCPKHSDLPDALNTLHAWHKAVQGGTPDSFSPTIASALLVSTSRLAENDDYNLSADRYRETIKVHHHWGMVKLQDVCLINPKKSEVKDLASDTLVSFIPMEDIDEHNITVTPKRERKIGEVYKGYTYFKDDDVLVAKVTPCFENGKGGIVHNLSNGIGFGTSELYVLRATDKVIPEYIYWIINREDFIQKGKDRMTGTGGLQRVPSDFVANYQIPLPPLEIQRQIVDEITAHQRIIDGARQVVEGWKPDIDIESDENWEVAKLDDLCEIVRGSSPRPRSNPKFYGGNVPRLMVADVTRDGMYVTPQIDTLTEEGAKQSRPMKKGDLVMAVSGQPGLCGILAIDACIHDGFAGFRNLNNKKILTEFAYHYLMSQREANDSQSVGAIFRNLNTDQLRRLEIPLPPLEVQREIVARIERERAIVEGNRELIRIYEEKVKKVIEKVWES